MLHKSKFVSFELHECVMGTIDHIEAVIKRTSLTMHKLIFRCPPEELIRTRRALSFPFGIALGFLIYWGLIYNFPFADERNSELTMWLMVSTITLGYVISVQARCVLLLILPTLLTGTMNTFFYTLLFSQIFLNVLFKKFLQIIYNLARTLICFFSFRIYLTLWMWRERTGRIGQAILETVAENDGSRIKDIASKFEDNKELLLDMTNKANGLVSNFSKACQRQTSQISDKCSEAVSTVGMLTILNAPFGVGKWFSTKLCELIIESFTGGNICDNMKKTFENALANVNYSLNFTFGNLKETNVTYPDVTEWNKQPVWNDFLSFEEEMLGNFSVLLDLYKSASNFFRTVALIVFFCGLLQANSYHREYLSSLIFENHYMDRYFRHLDEKRKALGKVYLLPLRGADRNDLVPVFSPAMTRREKQSRVYKWPFIISMILYAIVLITINILLGEFLNYIAEELNFVYRVDMHYTFRPEFTNIFGQNDTGICSLLNSLIDPFRIPYVNPKWEFNLNRCRFPVKELHFMEYLGTVLTVLSLIGIITTGTYLARSRKLICDYFYYRYSKERTLHLYNGRVRQRKYYLDERIEQRKEAVKAVKSLKKKFEMCFTAGRRKFPQTDFFLKRYLLGLYDWWTPKRCFVCQKRIQLPYFDCDTEACRLLYHEWCFADVGNMCLNCNKRQTNERFVIYDHPS